MTAEIYELFKKIDSSDLPPSAELVIINQKVTEAFAVAEQVHNVFLSGEAAHARGEYLMAERFYQISQQLCDLANRMADTVRKDMALLGIG